MSRDKYLDTLFPWDILLCCFIPIAVGLLVFKTPPKEPIQVKKTPPIDIVARKYEEMVRPIVSVETMWGIGSGTIIASKKNDDTDFFVYKVMTNAHVVSDRFVARLVGVDSLTGDVDIESIDTGCKISVFGDDNMKICTYQADIIFEDHNRDIAILVFESDINLPKVKLATSEMVDDISIFDGVFLVGCNLGKFPSPTFGMVSFVLSEPGVYGTTAQISPGCSGGGLFKEYDDHYYLIGIPFRAAVSSYGQFVPHLAQSISLDSVRKIIENN